MYIKSRVTDLPVVAAEWFEQNVDLTLRDVEATVARGGDARLAGCGVSGRGEGRFAQLDAREVALLVAVRRVDPLREAGEGVSDVGGGGTETEKTSMQHFPCYYKTFPANNSTAYAYKSINSFAPHTRHSLPTINSTVSCGCASS